MAKQTTIFNCTNCGASYQKWQGKCESCNEWNTIVEEKIQSLPVKSMQPNMKATHLIELVPIDGDIEDLPRIPTHINEFDRVLGGGIVPGSVVMIGGDPGIGKSTLLIQTATHIALGQSINNPNDQPSQKRRVVYISGEEAVGQVRMRARRLGLQNSPVELGAETNLRSILATLAHGTRPDVVIIDSIQTLWSDMIDSAPGTVSQVRTVAQDLVRFAKTTNTAVFIVGHVTKEGQIAGPRVVEHMVDTVLYFEGERTNQFRILRAVKNRFGAVDEIGVFEMTGLGLRQVENPSELFLGDRENIHPGTAVFAGLEGTRPFLIEIQALLSPTNYGMPRRAVVGWDSNRLSMIMAVLEARGGLSFGQYDVYLNVVGGLKIVDPAADLPVAAALTSALLTKIVPRDYIYFGELSLSGIVRSVQQPDLRLKESGKLGFTTAFIPKVQKFTNNDLKITTVQDVSSLIQSIKNN